MSGQVVYAVVDRECEGCHSIVGIFETKTDAEALRVEMLVAAEQSYALGERDVEVVEFPYFPAGDISLHPVAHFETFIYVHPDGSVKIAETRRWNQLSNDPIPHCRPGVFSQNKTLGTLMVRGVGATAEESKEDAEVRAVRVVAQLTEGINPLVSQW